MPKKPASEDEPKDKPTRTDRAQQVAEEYANDQREIIKKLREPDPHRPPALRWRRPP